MAYVVVTMHKLIIKPKSAETLCGLNIIAYYPMVNNGLHNSKLIDCTVDESLEPITCEKCKLMLLTGFAG